MSSFYVLHLLLIIPILQSANFETQCFDTDPLAYCAELDTSTTITSLIEEMNYFDYSYIFEPYGVIYNVTIIDSTHNPDKIISSIYMIGTNKLTTTSQLQWDISTFFMELFLNITDNKNIFIETQYDGLDFGLRIYDYVMTKNGKKYLEFLNEIYDKSSNPIQDEKGFIDLINSGNLNHKYSMSSYFVGALRDPISSEIQETIKQYVELFNYTNYKYKLWINSLESTSNYWDLYVLQQKINRDKLYKQQYQTLFQKYFDLMDSLLTYSYWYQDSNLYDQIFRWKQKSLYIFQRWLFKKSCIQIERDNFWIDKLTNSLLNDCTYNHGNDDNKCDNIVIIETYHIERLIQKLEDNINNVLNTNLIKFDVHRVKIDWLNHVDEDRDSQAIENAVKDTVRTFVEDLELFVSWQSQT